MRRSDRENEALSFYVFRIFTAALAVVYVVVEVINFLVVATRDAKSVTIPDETGKARQERDNSRLDTEM